jgi:hypothetical protein
MFVTLTGGLMDDLKKGQLIRLTLDFEVVEVDKELGKVVVEVHRDSSRWLTKRVLITLNEDEINLRELLSNSETFILRS